MPKKYIRGIVVGILAPWSWFYAFVMYIRNRCYDYGLKKSYTFSNRPLAELSTLASGKEENCEQPERHCEPAKQVWQSIFGDPPHSLSGRSKLLPPHARRGQKTILSKRSNTTIISIGNLAMGGTGKTPCIEYILRLLRPHFYTAVVSRGYKRKTIGDRIAAPIDNAWTLGDEPYQLYKKFASQGQPLPIIVGTDRVRTINKLLATYPATEVILLDDGFQHRRVSRNLNILLTTFQKPFFIDYPLPMGRLRESRHAAQRADIILVTKCPQPYLPDTRSYFKQNILKYTGREIPIFFTYIHYKSPTSLGLPQPFTGNESVILLTGIADANPLVQYVSKNYRLIQHLSFQDHHRFTKHDIQRIVAIFHQVPHEKTCILTTEKDSMRLMHPTLAPIIKDVPIFVLPMCMAFEEGEKEFNQLIFDCINR